MGQVIHIDELRRRRTAAARPTRRDGHAAVTCWFDLRGFAGAATYLAAERVDRHLERVRWRPALVDRPDSDPVAAWRELDARARALRMPLLQPEGLVSSGVELMRVAHLAASRGRGAAFALAAGRMAHCGGFDLDEPEVAATAADAAGLDHGEARAAADETWRDEYMREAGRRLGACDAVELPVLQVGGRLLAGERRVAEAVAVARAAR